MGNFEIRTGVKVVPVFNYAIDWITPLVSIQKVYSLAHIITDLEHVGNVVLFAGS